MTSMRQEPLVTSADEPLLLDSYLRECDVAVVHACIVNGDVKATWEAIRNADFASIPVVRSLLVLRSLPGASGDQQRRAAPAAPPFSLGDRGESAPCTTFLQQQEEQPQLLPTHCA